MKKESKRLLKSIFVASLVAALGFGMVPFQPIAQTFDTALVVNAEEETVTAYDGRTIPMSDVIAINGGRYYDNLLYAVFWADDGDTITLLKDYATDTSNDSYNNYMYLCDDTNVTVDLNGHTLTIDEWYWVTQYNKEKPGSVKFINGNIEGGCIVPNENAIITIGEGANVTAPEGIFAISGNHNYSMGSVVNIEEGSTVKSVDEVTIYWPQDGTLNITGGHLEGPTVVYARTGKVNISGGTLVATGKKNEAGVIANGTNPTGDTIVFQAFSSSYGDAPQVTVTGGEFSSVNGAAAKTYAVSQEDQDIKPDDFIQGGTFTSGGAADTSVAEYLADSQDNKMLATGEVISIAQSTANGYSVGVNETTGLAELTPDGTFIDSQHHAWYQLDKEGNLTIFGDGEEAEADSVFQGRTDIKTVLFTDNVKLSSLRGCFRDCTNLESVTNIPDCDNANMLFYGCKNLVEVSNFPKVETTSTTMFKDCEKLQKIGDGSPLVIETSGIVYGMFAGCKNLSADIIFDGSAKTQSGKQNIFDSAATANNAKITVCFGDNVAESTVAWVTSDVENAGKNVNIHDFVKDDVDDGINVYACRVCGEEGDTTYDVTANDGKPTEYKKGDTVTVEAPEDAENGAWFVNGTRIDTLKTAKKYSVDEDNNLVITVCEYVGTAEWKEFAGEVMSSSKRSNGGKRVSLTGTWALPEGAQVVKAGIARVYKEDSPEGFDNKYVYEKGTKKNSTVKAANGKYSFSLNMTTANAQKTLCSVCYVEYTLNDVTYTDISEICESAPLTTTSVA